MDLLEIFRVDVLLMKLFFLLLSLKNYFRSRNMADFFFFCSLRSPLFSEAVEDKVIKFSEMIDRGKACRLSFESDNKNRKS